MIREIEKIIEKEVESRCKEIAQESIRYKKDLEEAKKELSELRSLNKDVIEIERQKSTFEKLTNLVEEKNILDLFKCLNLKTSDINVNERDFNERNFWFLLLVKYYDDKNTLFEMLDLFKINYPIWAKNLRLPHDYNEKELEFVLERISSISCTNGNYFSNNIHYYYEMVSSAKGEIKFETFRSCIPWQLLLRNPLLSTEKFFNKMISIIESNKSNSNFLFSVTEFQKFSKEQIIALAEKLPERLLRCHEDFITANSFILKEIPSLSNTFKSRANDSNYSPFHFLKFPVEIQAEFIKQKDVGFEKKVGMINSSDLPFDEKMKFIEELLKKQ